MSYYPGLQHVKRTVRVIDLERSKIQQEKPYKFSKQYINYQTFLELIVMSQFSKKVPRPIDRTTAIYYHQSSLWDLDDIPIYGLSKETLALFKESKIDTYKDLFENLPQSLSTRYCILLPSGSFRTNGDHYIEVLWIDSMRNNSTDPQLMEYEFANETMGSIINPNSQRISVSAIDTSESTYCIFSDYPTVDVEIGNINDESDINDRALQIIKDLRQLALQIVMSIEFLPEAIALDIPIETVHKGFGKKPPSEKFWQIRQISVEQKRYIIKQKSDDSGVENARNSPRPHWRKWHWRRVAIGEGRKGREWRLISNTFVNPEE